MLSSEFPRYPNPYDTACLCTEPKKSTKEPVRIVDKESQFYGYVGWKFGTRISDNKVLVFFYVNKRTGFVNVFDWSQCSREVSS